MSTQDYSMQTFRPLLARLVQTPEYFTANDLKEALNHLFTPDVLHPAQIGALLTALHIHRVERRPESLSAAAAVLRERALKAAIEDIDKDFVVDIVGTGGDGFNLFNVSTTAAIVAAGAGARVVKHGSRASTSSSGSADLLESLDCLFTAPSPGTPLPIRRIPFTFILAPHYHPAMASIAPYRKALPFRTMFNVLGPLINPARPRGMVLGVTEKEIGYTFAQSLREGGVERALVVCGYEKMDEISCAGPTWVWELKDGQVTEGTLTPEDFGLNRHGLNKVAGGSPEENAETFIRLLNSGGKVPEDLIPILEFVLMNASALLVVAGVAKDYKEGTELARESVLSGKAWRALEIFREEGQKFAAENH
ncbi:hypothetical protein D9756_007099 [Leucocoprinus leucothites]|uniref:Anthranilate phosphoribosyltransferase n=1 Tax=Leucocoprinus leucothites TaxID=201217 RepID=A0A8H5FYJ3_9AGAR|nr:hypothetical protein D9756_007099 [Leucoagaricus leucothites]